jgi:hypothetical protein
VAFDPIGEAFARLALAIDQHARGYVEAYIGPADWRQEAEEAGRRPLAELAQEAEELRAAVGGAAEMDPLRRTSLAGELRAMATTLRVLQGEGLSVREEAEAFFDIVPEWVDERVFLEAHRVLEELLPPGESLLVRNTLRVRDAWVRPPRIRELSGVIAAELHRRTRARFPLPAGETFGVKPVQGQPWAACAWYLGELRSLVEINIDRPINITKLVDLMAHEGYPGHHTEAANKEARLLRERGWAEHSVGLINGPACAVSEGMASRALELAFPADELTAWYREVLFPRAGLGHLDPGREVAVDAARLRLEGVTGNAAILLLGQGAAEAEVEAYVRRYGIGTEEEARALVADLRELRSYVFTYRCGGELLDALFAARGHRDRWFARLLTEPVSPGQVRAWTGGPAAQAAARPDPPDGSQVGGNSGSVG